MKLLVAALVLSATSIASADMVTQDGVSYIVGVREASSFEKCAARICQIASTQSGADCSTIPLFNIVVANLTGHELDLVSKLRCVEYVEVDGQVEASPRVGREN